MKNISIRGLYVLIDPAFTASPMHVAEEALKGGASMIQLRCKNLTTSDQTSLARVLCSLCRKHKALFLVNDYPHVALISDADGVHLGQNDVPFEEARTLLGDDAIIGITVSTLEEAKQAESSGADYISVGHIFATTSKHKSYPPVGIVALKQICEQVSIPVMAIGGITTSNVSSVLDCGVTGVAVISAVCQSQDPLRATNRLVEIMRHRNAYRQPL